MKLSVTQKTFESYLLNIGYNYKIVQYETFIQTIRTIILREIKEHTLSNSLINYLEFTFSNIPSLKALEDNSFIDNINSSYIKNIIESGILDLHFKEVTKEYSKEIQIQAYKLKLINEMDKDKRELILSFFKFSKSVNHCFIKEQFTLTDKEIENISTFLKPKNKKELEIMVYKSIEILGNEADLNFIDISNITNLFDFFYSSDFNGDISEWDTSNVKYMNNMFFKSSFNGDISNWNTSKVEDMGYMFYKSVFNQNISNWDTSNITNMYALFANSVFNQDISNWNTSKVEEMGYMFHSSLFNQDISNWDTSNLNNMKNIFRKSVFNKDISKWNNNSSKFIKE